MPADRDTLYAALKRILDEGTPYVDVDYCERLACEYCGRDSRDPHGTDCAWEQARRLLADD